MDEQLDNDLSNRIREVFDNFEDPSYPSADEGWLLLRNKFPETEKKRPVAWLWWASAAAAVLLFVGIGLWMINPAKQQPGTIAVKPVTKQQGDNHLRVDHGFIYLLGAVGYTQGAVADEGIEAGVGMAVRLGLESAGGFGAGLRPFRCPGFRCRPDTSRHFSETRWAGYS